jgi:hypothetical protein
MEKRIPVPTALNKLITYVNENIDSLRNMVANASVEQLTLLGLKMEDGWRLDYDNKQFVLLEVPQQPEETTTE